MENLQNHAIANSGIPPKWGFQSQKHVDVEDVYEYMAMPKEKRTKKVLGVIDWYLTPYSLPWDLDQKRDETQWGIFEEFVKKNFPVQYFIRDVLGDFWEYRICRRLKDLWYKIECHTFNDRNKYLRKLLPKTWADKPELYRQIVFAMIEHYVAKDGEDALDFIVWDNDDAHKAQRAFIDDAIKWIQIDRPLLVKAAEERSIKASIEIEDEIDKKDKEILKGFAEYYRGFWT